MMIGLSGGLGDPGDICLDLATYQAAPCSGNGATLLCTASDQGGQHGQCGQMPGGFPVPILTLGDVLQRCSTPQCQVISAVAPGSQACDPLIRAAGYDCQTVGGGLINVWSKAAIVNGQLYTSQGIVPAPSANQYGLTPAQTSYLIQNGIIAPVISMNQTILPNADAQAPTSGPGAPNAVLAQYVQSNIPQAAALPPPTTVIPASPMQPGYSSPAGYSGPAPIAQPMQIVPGNVPAGTIPGAKHRSGRTRSICPHDRIN